MLVFFLDNISVNKFVLSVSDFTCSFSAIILLQEMILHQREMALLRFQQQEQEMQMKRMQMMGRTNQMNPISQPTEMRYGQMIIEPTMQGNGIPYGLLIFTLF